MKPKRIDGPSYHSHHGQAIRSVAYARTARYRVVAPKRGRSWMNAPLLCQFEI